MKTYLKLILAALLIFGAMSANAQNIKHGIVKYRNGDRYEGYYIRIPYYSSSKYANRTKIPYGDGGKYTYADGSIFEGTFTDGLPDCGKMTYAVEYKLTASLPDDFWICPAGCQFIGKFSNGSRYDKTKSRLIAMRVPYTGEFTNPIISKNNSKYIGRIEKRELSNGTIEYWNGDTFSGSFKNDKPFTGKYTYAQPTEIEDHGIVYWSIPAGCIFDGDFTTYTGCVDKEITCKDWNKDWTKYIGALKNGRPNGEGTMIYRNGNKYIGNLENGKPTGKGTMIYANGEKESGEWVDGMSPKEREAEKLKKEQKEEEKRLARQKAEKEKKAKKQALIRKYGQNYGSVLADGNICLSMTKEMVKEVVPLQLYDITSRQKIGNDIVETWWINKDKVEAIAITAIASQTDAASALALGLFMGIADELGLMTKYNGLVFTNDRLTGIY